MSVSWVTRFRKKLAILWSKSTDFLKRHFLGSFPVVFSSVFIVGVMVFSVLPSAWIIQSTHLIIGLAVLCLLILIIIIWGALGLEKRGVVSENHPYEVSQNLRQSYGVGVMLLALLLGLLCSLVVVRGDQQQEFWERDSLSRFTNMEGKIRVLVTEKPDDDHERTTLTGVILSGSKPKIRFSLPRYPRVSLGDICFLEGEIEESKNFDDFDYKGYLANRRVYRIMRVRSSECGKADDLPLWMRIKVALTTFKAALIADIDKSIPEPQSSLLAGIVFGQDRVFSESFEKEIRNSGVSHVVAASGYNISFVVGIAARVFNFVDRRKRIVLELLSVWLYCITSGLSASIVRAGLMYSIAQGFSYFGLYLPILTAMIATLALFVAIDPRIMSDVGFQLSYCATLGLIYILPLIQDLVRKLGLEWMAKSVVLPTLACTLTTLPITVLTFRTVPLLSILVNALVLPVIDSVLMLGVGALGLLYVVPQVSRVVFLIIWLQLKYFEYAISFFGRMQWAVINF
jgi:ComEC/Rec2-related protein